MSWSGRWYLPQKYLLGGDIAETVWFFFLLSRRSILHVQLLCNTVDKNCISKCCRLRTWAVDYIQLFIYSYIYRFVHKYECKLLTLSPNNNNCFYSKIWTIIFPLLSSQYYINMNMRKNFSRIQNMFLMNIYIHLGNFWLVGNQRWFPSIGWVYPCVIMLFN